MVDVGDTGGGDDDDVSLLIRCAMQTFDDLPISCPSKWTVLQLKKKIAVECPSKPEVKRQRLIYAGRCLHDEHTLKSVFELRPIDDGNVHVLHLVYPPKNPGTLDGGTPVLRRRTVNRMQPPSSSPGIGGEAEALSRNFNNIFQFYPNPVWASGVAAGTQGIPGFTTASTNAQFQNAYQAYMVSYSNYMYQMMSALGNNNPNSIPFSPQFLLNNQHANLPAQPVQQAPAAAAAAAAAAPNQPQQAFAAEPNLAAAAPAAGGIVQEAVAGDVDGPQRDFLDVVYKARRDRNNRERADRELAAAVNNVRQPQQIPADANREHPASGNPNDTAAAAAAGGGPGREEPEPREPTAWVVFWSTCYTFITSFFSSLIPENPVPVNVN